MKITNLDKGEILEVYPDTKIEVERTNPFFNEYGEQAVPFEIPASEHNRRLLGFPDTFGRIEKMTPANVAIQDGEFYSQCRQYILAATRKGSISTSFYLNDGSFYSRIQNVKLTDIFDDVIEFQGDSVEQKVTAAIEFCRQLRNGNDPRFAIFPVLVDDDSGLDRGFSHKIVNAFGHDDTFNVPTEKADSSETFSAFNPDNPDGNADFYNAQERVEYVDTLPISLTPGYYISPFVRAAYVLRRVFGYFGYELVDNFFTTVEPFSSMVLLNNVIDPLVNGRLRIADLLPDVSVSDFLALFRKKFCCEFTADEGKRQADVVFLKDVVDMQPVADLTSCLTAEPTISYKAEKDYKRITLSPKDTVGSDIDGADNIKTLVQQHPAAYLDPYTGDFYKDGFSGNYRVKTKIGDASMEYSTGEELEEQQIEIPECMPEFRPLLYRGTAKNDADFEYNMGTFLYVGAYTTRNSKMMFTGSDDEETTEDSPRLMPMLAFTHMTKENSQIGRKPAGTISAYDIKAEGKPRIFDYALYYYGEYGIFERFYRHYDTLLRNSLQDIKMKLLLSQSQKQNLSAYGKVVVRNTPFFFNKLKFTLGGKEEPVESEMRTLTLTTPVLTAATTEDLLPMMRSRYRWVGKVSTESTTKAMWENSGLDKERTFKTIYPPIPTAQWVGKQYAMQTSYTERMVRHGSFWRHAKYAYTKTTCWLTVEEI